jgi:hypothetical protein
MVVEYPTIHRFQNNNEWEEAVYNISNNQENNHNYHTAILLPLQPKPNFSAIEVPLKVTSETNKERKIILPPSSSSAKNYLLAEPRPQKVSRGITARLKHLRPATKFRAALALATVACLSLTSLLWKTRWTTLLTTWFRHRGFQGLSSFGRTIGYAWALLVAYPRLLDKKASERKQRERERYLEQRRAELYQLAAEVSRLSQELSSIDAEIRAFRREIISLQALSTEKSDDTNKGVREAIRDEMSHLAQIRSDAQAALSAARQTWAEARAQSPPEAWPRNMHPR